MLRRRIMMQSGGGEDFPILVRGVSENDDELLTIFYSKRMCASADIMMKSEAEAVVEFPNFMFASNTKISNFECLQYFINLERVGNYCFNGMTSPLGSFVNFNIVCDKINYIGDTWTFREHLIIAAPNKRLVFRADDLRIGIQYPFGNASSNKYSYDIHICGKRVQYPNSNLFATCTGNVRLYIYDTAINFQTYNAIGWGGQNLTIYVPYESLDAMKAAYPNNAKYMVGWNPETEGV